MDGQCVLCAEGSNRDLEASKEPRGGGCLDREVNGGFTNRRDAGLAAGYGKVTRTDRKKMRWCVSSCEWQAQEETGSDTPGTRTSEKMVTTPTSTPLISPSSLGSAWHLWSLHKAE